MKPKPEPAETYAGYTVDRNYHRCSIHFYSKASKRRIGIIAITPGRSLRREDRWAAIAEFLKTNPQIGMCPDYKPTKAEIKKAKL